MHLRTALAFCLVASGPAFAQPANDACDNALAIPAPAGLESTRSPVTAVFGASSQIEAPIACAPAPQNSVWYSFTPTVAGRYELSTCNTGYLQTSVEDFAMAVYSGPCNALSLVTNGCNDTWCGDRPRVVVDLLAGQTYRIQIARADSPTETADTVQLSAVRTSGADSCAGPVPELTLDTTVAVATIEGETNDAQVGGGAACYLGVGNSTTATTQEASRRDRVHRFTAPRNGRYSFRTGFSLRSYDVGLHLSDSCVAPMTPPQVYTPPQCIAAANRLGASTTAQEEVSCLPMITGQQLYVWVDEGVVQPTASIGGTVGLVVTECTVETEPNDSPATASALACGTTGTSAVEVLQADGGITRSGGDVDFFSLGQPQAGDRLFAMVEAAAASSSTLQMRVTTNTDTVEYDTDDLDTDFGGSSGGVAGTPLTAQPHFLRVNADSATTTIQPYHVYAVIQSGTPTPETEPNDTPATANLAPNNYFSGTTPGNTTATFDVDFFAFQAKAGDLIYLSLDSHPQRSGTTPTPNHTLALWDAYGQQVFVNAANTAVLNTPGTGMTATTPEVPSENVLYRATYTGTYYARVSRTGTNAAASLEYVLSVSINCSTGGGFTQPALSSVSPTQGSSLGGETVTLSGSGFGPASQVTFDGARATVSASSPNQLIVRTPVGSEGRADVAVTNLGYAASVLDGGFEYVTPVAPPTVTTVTPAQGAATGGQTVTITGQLFKPGAEVTFDVGGDVRPGTNVNVVNLTRLTVTTPAHVPGSATVTVRNPVDALEGSLADGYRFNAPPIITAVTPATGLITGGTTVTLSGSGFVAGALVRFSLGAGTGVTVDPSGNSLTTVVPSTTNAGPVEVLVINPDGQQASLPDGYRYSYPPLTLASVSPASGPSAGGTVVTLSGTNFFPSATVLINDVPAVNVTRVNATTVTAVTPPGSPGVVSVAIANTDGQQVTQIAAFAYVAPPTVTGITPASGSALGNTLITVTGADLRPGVSVRVGGSPAFNAVLVNPTTVTALTPSGLAGPADVELINPDGQRGVLPNAFTYGTPAALTSLSPVGGATSGGTVVTLTGSGFVGGTEVMLGTQAATSVTVVSATQLTAVAPAAPMSVVAVSVRTPDGQMSALSSAFRYVEAPTLTALAPTSGDSSGGTVVRLTGGGFGAQTAVRFGGVASPLVTLVNPTTLDAVTPAGMPGVVDVSIANPDGAEVTLAQAFTYTRGAPVIAAFAPASGPTSGGTMLTISGSGFAANVTVMVGGVALSDVVMASPELLRGRVPAHEAGTVDVVVTNDDGQSATASGAYTYVAAAGGNQGVADGGNGGLGEAPDAGTTPTMPTGCGCSGVEGSALMFAALGLLLRRRRG